MFHEPQVVLKCNTLMSWREALTNHPRLPLLFFFLQRELLYFCKLGSMFNRQIIVTVLPSMGSLSFCPSCHLFIIYSSRFQYIFPVTAPPLQLCKVVVFFNFKVSSSISRGFQSILLFY